MKNATKIQGHLRSTRRGLSGHEASDALPPVRHRIAGAPVRESTQPLLPPAAPPAGHPAADRAPRTPRRHTADRARTNNRVFGRAGVTGPPPGGPYRAASASSNNHGVGRTSTQRSVLGSVTFGKRALPEIMVQQTRIGGLGPGNVNVRSGLHAGGDQGRRHQSDQFSVCRSRTELDFLSLLKDPVADLSFRVACEEVA